MSQLLNRQIPTVMILLVVAAALYWGGLNGPFLFDDHVHITQNRWVKIESLSWPDLVRAWNSSFSAFPTSRPLAQVSFGINHALSGLEPWAFKATNLAIHLACGVAVFVLARLSYRVILGAEAPSRQATLFAASAAAAWLLHPMHVSTVLYTVQRMAQLGALSLLVALCFYVWGRIRLSEGRGGTVWILAAAPVAMLGFLGKETAALLPLLLLVVEATLLNRLPGTSRRTFLRSVHLLYIALPILVAIAYFAMHPGYFDHSGREFTLQERVLTQARVLVLYLRWLLVPDIANFGLFHDDVAVSHGLLDPPQTLLAIVFLAGLAIAAIAMRQRYPMAAFATLFFLAAHVLESTAFPLEMVFEHRNYLASVGPLMLLAYLVVHTASTLKLAAVARVLGLLLLLSYATVTYLRVQNWSSYESFVLSAAENHPRSARSNFLAGQFLIAAIDKTDGDSHVLADAARTFLYNGLAANPRCINCLFGLLVLDLHLDQAPGPDLLQQLAAALREGHVDAQTVSISQFSYLVSWMKSGESRLTHPMMESIFDAALANPRWNHTGRGGIEAAYREYHEFVTQDLDKALVHARAAVAAWPDQWSYHMQLVQVLRKLGREAEAAEALEHAASLAKSDAQRAKMDAVRALLPPES